MTTQYFDVAIVGAGAAGIATAASLKKRQRHLSVVLIDPAETHYYQPGWTMVGGGVFQAPSTARPTASVVPSNVAWIQQSVRDFQPDDNLLTLEDGSAVGYEQLVVAPGLTLDWDGVEGLTENLGRNGVTSNYAYHTASYTWELVQNLKSGTALFT